MIKTAFMIATLVTTAFTEPKTIPEYQPCVTVGEIKNAIQNIPDDTVFYLDGDEYNDCLAFIYTSDGRLYIEASSIPEYAEQ